MPNTLASPITNHISSPTVTSTTQSTSGIANTMGGSNFNYSEPSVIRSPIRRYEGHSDACIAAEWFPDGELLATASWDRTANVYNVETGKILCNLQHDDYLTNVTMHMSQKIILTSSKDTTFKIWDFRDPICSVQIYQGHTRSVNSAIFVDEDKIATASDDQHVKLWDLRVMRSPVFSVNANSGVNRICAIKSSTLETYICAPLDNRDIKIYNMNGERVLRFPRNSRNLIGHRRLVTSVASSGDLLFSASFDKCVNCWSFDHTPPKSSLASRFLNKENSSNTSSDLLNDLFANVVVPAPIPQIPATTSTHSAHLVSNGDSVNLVQPSTPIQAGTQTSTTPPPETPTTPQQPLSHITNNGVGGCLNTSQTNNSSNTTKNVNTLTKLTEKIKI